MKKRDSNYDSEQFAELIAELFFESLSDEKVFNLSKILKSDKVKRAVSSLDEKGADTVDLEIAAIVMFYAAFVTKHFYNVSEDTLLRAYELSVTHYVEARNKNEDIETVGKLFTDRYNTYEKLLGDATSPKDDDRVAEHFLSHVLLIEDFDLDVRYYAVQQFGRSRFRIGRISRSTLG